MENNNDRNAFADYDIAYKLKEKNFDLPCNAYYTKDKGDNSFKIYDDGLLINSNSNDMIAAPYLETIKIWLFNEYRICVEVVDIDDCSDTIDGKVSESWESWEWAIYDEKMQVLEESIYKGYETYEEALSQSIRMALKFI